MTLAKGNDGYLHATFAPGEDDKFDIDMLLDALYGADGLYPDGDILPDDNDILD